jgi:hypothetical protein
MDFLLFPGGFIGAAVVLFWYVWKTERGKRRSIFGRTSRIIEAKLSPVSDIESGYAAVEASVKQLRAAKTEENQLYIDRWEKQFYSEEEYKKILMERHPTKMLNQASSRRTNSNPPDNYISAATIKSTTISTGSLSFTSPPILTTVDDGPEWKPLPYTHKRTNPDEELSYTQRRIQRAGAFVRAEPHDQAETYGVAVGGSVQRFDGFVHGQAIAGNTVWFFYVGEGSGLRKYVHSIATTNRSTSGMQDYTEYDEFSVMSACGEVVLSHKEPSRKYPGGTGLQLPVSEVARRKAEGKYLNPDEEKELAREPAIVANYQEERRKDLVQMVLYDPVPKNKIPSTVRPTYY